MTKTEQFKNAAQKLTYGDVAKQFNNLNDTLVKEYYYSSTDLITPEGEHVPGFVYTGYVAGVGIRRILDWLGLRYTTHMKGGSGIDEKSEIHISDQESKKRILNILEKTGEFRAYHNHDLEKMLRMAKNPLLEIIR